MKTIVRKLLILSSLFVPCTYSKVTEEILQKIFKQHCSQLKNTDIEQKPFVITFSGAPGMGKSTIAKKLEDIYKAVRISTDELRDLFNSSISMGRKEYEDVLQEYMKYFFKHYKLPNRRMILDASIDRKHTQLFPFFEKNNINFVVIRLEVPRDLIVKRLNDREGDKASWYLKNLDSFLSDYNNFANNYKNYISYANPDESKLDKLTNEIDKKINKQ